jgi:hypothetical protein
MDAVELRLERLVQHLARENRQLLAMLRLGFSLRRAEQILQAERDEPTTVPSHHDRVPDGSSPPGRG